MATDLPLPNLFVIGAAKAGTTSLHRYLGLHPEVSMSSVKEPRLFVESGYPGSLRRAAGLFERAPVRGESTAVYSQYPGWPGIPERVAEHVPAARIVYLVRDPIDRALAHYRQHLHDGKEERPASVALADPLAPDHTYLTASRYATQIRRWLDHFPREQVLIVDQRALRGEREVTLARIFGHVGVDPRLAPAGDGVELNTRAALARPTRLGRALRRSGVTGVARRLPGAEGIRRRARPALSRPIPDPELPPTLRAELIEALRPEAEGIREISGLELADWGV